MSKHVDNGPTTPTYRLTREDWLHRAAEMMAPMIFQVSGVELPEFHVSMGHGGVSYENKEIRGVCWKREVSDDGRNHVFISPALSDTAVVLAVLLHELIHLALDTADDARWNRHTHTFAEYATRLGMTAPFTTATPDISLTAELMVIAGELGEFPHAALHIPSRKPAQVPAGSPTGGGVRLTSGPGTQTNRWISFGCPVHNTPVRMSRTKAALGAPFCGQRDEATGQPCLQEMKER